MNPSGRPSYRRPRAAPDSGLGPPASRFQHGRSIRTGDTLYILLGVLIVLFILAMSIGWIYRQQAVELGRYTAKVQAYHLALSGIEKALLEIRRTFDQPLLSVTGSGDREEMHVNAELLNLLDPERAREWTRVFTFADGDITRGGTAKVLVEVLDMTRNEFFTHIDRVEKIPPGLEPYRERRDEEDNPVTGAQPLGGWAGKLKLTCQATFRDQRAVIEQFREIKVTDISPPAPDHSLFIHGKATEYLKDGTFLISNLDLPEVVLKLIHELTLRINESLRIPEVSQEFAQVFKNIEEINKKLTVSMAGQDVETALKLVYEISQNTSDEKIKDTVDNIILSLNPRDWGRVRTNGVLQIYVPFFAPDDIINYFSDGGSFGYQRPEVGYHLCYNRLHDSYLSVYTHYEGYIYKNYRRLDPVNLGPTKVPQVIPPQRYTINTRMNYVLRYPNREQVPNLERLQKSSAQEATMLYRRSVSLLGTRERPIELDGIWHCREDVRIGGHYTGRGLLVCEKDIHVVDHVRRIKDNDSLGIVSLGGAVALKVPSGETTIESAVYARDGLKGAKTSGVKIAGNLAVETLNRDQMPRSFVLKFDHRYKNHVADNLRGSISRRLLMFRIPSDQTVPRARRNS